ncbi:MAG: metallophosphoesterase [Candidatus Aureabacteria bacterium]|nr:metallophosphoesterase [Candidatus Auribacterota bacterium]
MLKIRKSIFGVILLFSTIAAPAFGQLRGLELADLKSKARSEGWTFTVGENSATSRSLSVLCGLKEQKGWLSKNVFDLSEQKVSLPSTFDWRSLNGCTPIRDQGDCGSCWAFGTVGPLECAIKIKEDIDVDLSEQWLLSCNNEGWNCIDGGWWAHDYLQWKTDSCGGTGAVLESASPYMASDDPCQCPYQHPYKIDSWAFIGSPDGVPSVNSIKQAIMDYGPVSVAVYASNAFQAYTGGVFNACQNYQTNHAVVLVGWDDNQGANGVWFLRNSWGEGWGEDGYMRIEYGCSRVGYSACYVNYNPSPTATATVAVFAVISDYGESTSPYEGEVATQVVSWNPDFIVTAGDNNTPDGEEGTIDANVGQYYHSYIYPYTGAYGAGATMNLFFPALGNHDWHTNPPQPYLDYFTLPGNERYYDVVKGPVHIFILDSDPLEPDGETSTSTQAVWLQNQLAASSEPWKLVVCHHPPYSSGTIHGSTTYMQWPFQEWGATAVISGHDHGYERIIMNGFPYFVDGLGGQDKSNPSYSFTDPPVAGSEVRYNSDYGAMKVEADDSSIKFQFISQGGTVVDTYILTASPTATPTETPTITPTPTGTISIVVESPIPGPASTETATPTPQAEIILNGSSFNPGDALEARFVLHKTINRAFTAFAVVILPDGTMLNVTTLNPKPEPVVENMPGLTAPFAFPLLAAVVPAGVLSGGYEIVVALFDPQGPISRREDAFLDVSARFSVGSKSEYSSAQISEE